jgi:hypothetical protein
MIVDQTIDLQESCSLRVERESEVDLEKSDFPFSRRRKVRAIILNFCSESGGKDISQSKS